MSAGQNLKRKWDQTDDKTKIVMSAAQSLKSIADDKINIQRAIEVEQDDIGFLPNVGFSRNHPGIQLWQFIIELLLDENMKDIIRWTSNVGEFRLVDPDTVSRLWGVKKNREHMNYEKLSRGLRYYYSKRILQKVQFIPYGYKFEQLPAPHWEAIVNHFRDAFFYYVIMAPAVDYDSSASSTEENPDDADLDPPEAEPLPVVMTKQEVFDPPEPKERKITALDAMEKCLEKMKNKKQLQNKKCSILKLEDVQKIDIAHTNVVEMFDHGDYQIFVLEKKK